MMPDRVLSTTPQPAPFLPPKDLPYDPKISLEYGGTAVGNASQGLFVKVWQFQLFGTAVRLSAPGVLPVTLFTRAGITEISGCFDQNMRPAVAFMQAGQMVLWWFDTVEAEQVFVEFDGASPRLTMDDKRRTQSAANDIILAYVKDGMLCNRTQRDRFETEDELGEVPEGYLFTQMGMSSTNRLQFAFTPTGSP